MNLSPEQREYRLHVACVEHIDECFPGIVELMHPPNRPGDAADGFFKKKMGARPGAPDLWLSWNHGAFDSSRPFMLECALVELKVPPNKLSTAQNKFMSSYARIGWKTKLCYTVKQVHDALVGWGLKPRYNSVVEPDMRSDSEKFQDALDFYRPA